LYGNDEVDVVLARFEGLPPPPIVTGVFVSGGGWSDAFKRYLFDNGLGDAAAGYRAWDNTRRPVLRSALPWINLDRVSVRFDRDADVPIEALTVHGINVPLYPLTPGAAGFAYDPATHTATWTFGRGVTDDRLLINLDLASLAGGPFQLRLDVLPGDVDDSGVVLASDFSDVKKKFFRSTEDPGPAGATQYTPFHDVDGTGVILANDFSEVKKRFFDALPPAPPLASSFEELTVASGPRDLLG
jgi:hypothetical protein